MAKNNMAKVGESTEYLLAQAKAEMQRAKRQATRPPVAVMFERAAAGADFMVVKSFKSGGKMYQRGDIIHPNPSEDRWLIEHGFAIPSEIYEANNRANALRKFIQDDLAPKEYRFREVETLEKRAVETLETVRLQLEAATEALRLAQGQKAVVEGDLRAVLDRMLKNDI